MSKKSILLSLFLFYPITALAAEEEREALGISGFVGNFYEWALGIGGLVALGAFIFGGILYITSAGNASRQDDAKQWITGALVGLFLLFGSSVILNTINPDLLQLQEIFLKVNEETKEISYTIVDNATGQTQPFNPTGENLREQVKAYVNQGKIIFAHENDRQAVETGYAVRRIGYGSDKVGDKVPIDPKIWQLLVYIVQNGYSVRVSSMLGTHPWCTSSNTSLCPSRHWDGHAIDIDMINDQLIYNSSAKAVTISLMKDLLKLQGTPAAPRQVICNGNGRYDPDVYTYEMNGGVRARVGAGDHTDHIHIGF